MQVLVAHLGELGHNHVDHLVAATEVVVERNGHAIFETALADSLFKGGELGTFALRIHAELGIFLEIVSVGRFVHFRGYVLHLGGTCLYSVHVFSLFKGRFH